MNKIICRYKMCPLYGHMSYETMSKRKNVTITKTRQYNFGPVKLGLTGVYIIFLILLKSIDYGYSLDPPRRGGSNEYP